MLFVLFLSFSLGLSFIVKPPKKTQSPLANQDDLLILLKEFFKQINLNNLQNSIYHSFSLLISTKYSVFPCRTCLFRIFVI